MITKDKLIAYFGTAQIAAEQLGYGAVRGDNNITRLPDVLTKRQASAILMRMRAANIKIPKGWK